MSNLWPMLGFGTGSGGIGLYMKRLDQQEQQTITFQQLLEEVRRMPESPHKQKAMLELTGAIGK
jgi:hypothetical protein